MPKTLVRASEVAEFAYCRRAWWYARQGYPSAHLDQQTTGTKLHARHGRRVIAARFARYFGFVLLLLSVVGAAVYLLTVALG